MKLIKSFSQFINEGKKPKGAPDFHHSDAPDAEGRFRDLGIKDLAAWLIKTREKDVKRISGSLTQQIVFNRKRDPKYAEKMEKTRKEVYKQLGREDLLEDSFINESTEIKYKGKQYWININDLDNPDNSKVFAFLDKDLNNLAKVNGKTLMFKSSEIEDILHKQFN
jgi:hypothetical protein